MDVPITSHLYFTTRPHEDSKFSESNSSFVSVVLCQRIAFETSRDFCSIFMSFSKTPLNTSADVCSFPGLSLLRDCLQRASVLIDKFISAIIVSRSSFETHHPNALLNHANPDTAIFALEAEKFPVSHGPLETLVHLLTEDLDPGMVSSENYPELFFL